MKDYDLVEIVEKLIGEIKPTGDSGMDFDILHNQRELIMLIDYLTDNLCDNIYYSNRVEGSMKKIGEEAKNSIMELIEKLRDSVEE